MDEFFSPSLPVADTPSTLDDLFSMDSSQFLGDTDYRWEDVEAGSSNDSDQMSLFTGDNDVILGSNRSSSDYSSSENHSPTAQDHSIEHAWFSPLSNTCEYSPPEYGDQWRSPPSGPTSVTPSIDQSTRSSCTPQSVNFAQQNRVEKKNSTASSAQKPRLLYLLPDSYSSKAPTPNVINIVTTSSAQIKQSPKSSTLGGNPTLYAPINYQLTNAVANAVLEEEELHRKREERRMKNRVAAQVSRVKKQSELQTLHSQIKQLETENDKLRRENAQLKLQLASLSSWNVGQPVRKKAMAASLCAVALIFLVSMPQPFAQDKLPTHSPANVAKPETHHGRTLGDIPATGAKKAWANSTVGCGSGGTWFNTTESIRLNADLNEWISRHEKLDELSIPRGKHMLIKRIDNKQWPAVNATERVAIDGSNSTTKPKRSMRLVEANRKANRDRSWRHLDMISETSEAMRDQQKKARKVYAEEATSKYDQLARLIQHKNDTLYLVTMKDYFLLPAIDKNGLSRPRISLILPAFNGTAPNSNQKCYFRVMTAKYQERLAQIEQVLLIDKKNIDMVELRSACRYGVPETLRPLVWRLLLDYLPTERHLWRPHLATSRNNYNQLVEQMIVQPGTSEETHDEDHPLCDTSGSEWNSFFSDNEVLQQIDKDVRRLCPEMHFFQGNTAYPHERAAQVNLSRRVTGAEAEAQDYGLDRFGAVNVSSRRRSAFQYERANAQGSETHWQVVERILFVYAKLNKGVKYVQGMAEVIGPLYYVFASDADVEWSEHAEADSFFCFQQLMSEIKDNFIKTLDDSSCGIESSMSSFHALIESFDPQLFEHLTRTLEIKPQFYAFRWLSILLSQEFPLPDVISIWDSLFSDATRFSLLPYVCLAMVERIRTQLLEGTFADCLRTLQNYPEVDVLQIVLLAHALREGNARRPGEDVPVKLSFANQAKSFGGRIMQFRRK